MVSSPGGRGRRFPPAAKLFFHVGQFAPGAMFPRLKRSAGPRHTVFHFPRACAARRAARGGGCAARGLVTWGGRSGGHWLERASVFLCCVFRLVFSAAGAWGGGARLAARGSWRAVLHFVFNIVFRFVFCLLTAPPPIARHAARVNFVFDFVFSL